MAAWVSGPLCSGGWGRGRAPDGELGAAVAWSAVGIGRKVVAWSTVGIGAGGWRPMAGAARRRPFLADGHRSSRWLGRLDGVESGGWGSPSATVLHIGWGSSTALEAAAGSCRLLRWERVGVLVAFQRF
jgi:hypothetical protein